METYEFTCRCGHGHFTADAEPFSSSFHLIVGVATLGVWLVIHACYRLFRLYQLSRCPFCARRSRRLLWGLVSLCVLTAEVGWVLSYFLLLAPQKIVADASFASLPADLRLDEPLRTQDWETVIGFIWLVAAQPGAGLFIAANWPYIVLIWFSILTLIGFILPSFYQKKSV